MTARRVRAGGLALLLLGTAGCGVGPRTFLDLQDPAPIVRARAAGLGDDVPDAIAIPALIDRLEDGDGVVRLSAHEALKRRTGMDFGFVPWDEAPARAEKVARWRQ